MMRTMRLCFGYTVDWKSMTPDMINGMFELMAALLVGNHCRVVLKDRCVKGVSVASTAIFTLWGFWNIFFYENLEQWYSLGGGIMLMLVNTLYVLLLLHFR